MRSSSQMLCWMSSGVGRIKFLHPGAVVGVSCGAAICDLEDDTLVVRRVSRLVSSIVLRLRLSARTFLKTERGAVRTTEVTVPILHCPLSLVSGPVPRDADQTRLVVRMSRRCGLEPNRLSWDVNDARAQVEKIIRNDNANFVVLTVGRVLVSQVRVLARFGRGKVP